ncbi:redoxin domain-containing protein [Anaerobaca lacustris]|uniref:Redoxin domain-containing protein n=1 Tax=Anaerobaca lacustris TaxID=3044600 RepID=A0AAW6TWE4_9BACT|nr:redoxin domain-containing protein [Sedimentisphaerales bacterium M17dextr]
MSKKINIWILVTAAAVVVEGWALYVVGASSARWRPAMIVAEEPAARALYEAMVQAARDAETLSYRSICSGPDSGPSAYTVQLKKPNLVHVEMTNGMSTKVTTVLGDGDRVRIFWSGDRPFLKVDDFERNEPTQSNVYVDMTGSPAEVADEMARLGVAWSDLVWSPSVFFNGADEFEPHIDGIRLRGTNEASGEECDVIEVSYFKAQRTRHYWLSRKDHLPRRIKEIVRLAGHNRVIAEDWFRVEIDERISDETFAWTPPEGSDAWTPPEWEEFLLKPGTEAPDFELALAQKGVIRLSDLRGKVVWLCLWQVGSPECREQMRYLQSLHEKTKDTPLAVLGANVTDDRRIAQAFLRDEAISLPCVLDSSEEVAKLFAEGYGMKSSDGPVNFVIGRDGKIVDAWYGQDRNRAPAALQAAGVQDVDR